MSTKNKAWNEDFAKFFAAPSREGLRDLLKNHVGEFDNLDFKQNWPEFHKLARHILGLANSGGGCLCTGMKEKDDKTFEPVGVEQLLDKADLKKGIQKFIPSQVRYEIVDFSYDDREYGKLVGKKFQIIFVEDIPEYIPFISKSDGVDIQESVIYIRRGTSTEKANYEELQELINRRIETGYSSQEEFGLNRHLSELRILYDQIPDGHLPFSFGPSNQFDQFVHRMIDKKKAVIASLVGR
jgi:hypothetical protein